MKLMVLLLFLSISLTYNKTSADDEVLTTVALKEISFDNEDFDDSASIESAIRNESFSRGSDIDSLLHAKFKLINGDLKLAKFYLNRIDDKTSKLFAIKKRYQSTIAFMEGHFKESLDFISDKKFFEISIYPHVCLLRLINFMALNNADSLQREKKSCMYYTGKFSKNDQYWLDTMVKLKLKDARGVKKNMMTDIDSVFSDDEMSKLWLKTGLYLNNEKDMLTLISMLPEGSYQSKRLREIVAFMYLRSGSAADKQKALAFVDDIDSANAENIKGNINLQNKEYELAFGHFRLALQKKQDSTNSLERAIPLSWLLNQWKDGLAMLDSNTNKTLDPRNKRAIRVAFLIREKRFAEAEKELALLKIDFQQVPPFEVNIMDSYVSLIKGEGEKKYDKRKVEESAETACRSFDGISCWISLQFIEWENLGKTIKRDEAIFTDKEMTIDSLKEKKVLIPIKETIIVDQKDIEELDGEGIQLMKRVSK